MRKALTLLMFLGLSTFACAGSYTIDFEQYAGYTQITNQYAADGVTFQSALQLVAPSYDYFDFPPHSGNGVITDDPDSTITMSFLPGKLGSAFSGWFSGPAGMTATAYDGSNHVLGTFTGSTLAGTNQQFFLNGSSIAYITFDDLGGGDYLTLDDLSWTQIPEPSTTLVLVPGLLTLGGLLRNKWLMNRN